MDKNSQLPSKLNRRRFLAGLGTTIAAVPTLGLSALPGDFAKNVVADNAQFFENNPATRNLMPLPVSVRFADGRLVLTKFFTVALQGADDARLQAAITRMMIRLARRTGFTIDPESRGQNGKAMLVIRCEKSSGPFPALYDDEAYKLSITTTGATLSAATTTGVLRGLETLLQLVETDESTVFWPEVEIEDRPRFPWRGLLLDVSRHFEPLEMIYRNLDAMAAVKLNVFHWHLTDDEGFRIQSLLYPKLTGKGSDGKFYTQQQVKDVVHYAAERGIRVIPEFDLPGHCTSWLVGYPELGSLPPDKVEYHVERLWGIFPNAMNPSDEGVYRFLDNFLREMASLFPDEWVHLGGDEAEGIDWLSNPAILKFMREQKIPDAPALQAYFTRRAAAILRKHNKKMVGWEEVAAADPQASQNIALQIWKGTDVLAESARQGRLVILSAGYYLPLPAAIPYTIDPIIPNANLTEEQQAKVLGGEACIWGERTDMEIIDGYIWPQTAAIAERLWSRADVRDIDDMYRRLAVTSIDLEDLGLTHSWARPRRLRWLARGNDIVPLLILADAVIASWPPQALNQFMPLVHIRVAVAAQESGCDLRKFLHALLSDAPRFQRGRGNLAKLFEQWQVLPQNLAPLCGRMPLLKGCQPIADRLAIIGKAGQEALDYLAANKVAPQSWADQAKEQILAPLQTDTGLILLADKFALELIFAAANARTADDWRNQIKDAVIETFPQQFKQLAAPLL